jgi:hypothetical protein
LGNNPGGILRTNPQFTVTLAANQTVRAQYSYVSDWDVDGDLLPDDWEVRYFGSTTNAVPNAGSSTLSVE